MTDSNTTPIIGDSMNQVNGAFQAASNRTKKVPGHRINKKYSNYPTYSSTSIVDHIVTDNSLLEFIIEEIPNKAFKMLPDIKGLKPNVERDLLDKYISGGWIDLLRLTAQLGRRYGAAYIFMEFENDVNYESPVNLLADNIISETFILDQDHVRPAEATFHGYKTPTYYQVQLGARVFKVHQSRLLCFYGNKLHGRNLNQHGHYHLPIWSKVIEHLGDYEDSVTATADLMRDVNVLLYEYKGLHDLLELARSGKRGEVVGQLIDRISTMLDSKSIINNMIIDQENESLSSIDRDYSNLEKIVETLRQAFCERTEYPQSILFKSASGNLFSETGASDRYSMADTVNSWQLSNLTPNLNRLFRLLDRRAVGFSISYPSTVVLTNEEQAQTLFTTSKAIASLIQSGVWTPSIAARCFDHHQIKTHVQLTPSEVEQATAMAMQMAESGVGNPGMKNSSGSTGEGTSKSN